MNRWGKTLLIMGLLTIGGRRAAGQDQSRFLGLTVGAAPLQIKDFFHSDYTYRGTGIGLQAFYRQERLRTQWQLEAGYTRATPQSIVSRPASTRLIDALFNYRWRFSRVHHPENRLHLFGGAGVRFVSNTTNYSPDINVRTVLATAAASLGGSANGVYRINAKQQIQAQLFLPLINAVYRPNYEYAGRDQFTVSRVGQNGLFDGQIRYSYQLSKPLQVVGTYQVTYFRFEQPRPVIGVRQGVGVGIQWRF
ncbi:hypothetical protein GCM10027299_48040 [Larkinella ripae]